jgi:hypothetical protein
MQNLRSTRDVVVVAWFALIFLGFGLFALRCLAVTLTTVPVGKKTREVEMSRNEWKHVLVGREAR